MMILQRRSVLQAAMMVWATLAMTVLAVPVRADSLSVGASDVGTRVTVGSSSPTLTHGSLQLLDVLVDNPDQRSVDSIVEFDITPLKIPQGVVIQSATLTLDIAGAQTLAVPASLSVNGYPDGDGVVGLGDFVKNTTLLGSTGSLADALPGTVDIPFNFNITSFIQTLADQGTMKFVGFHLEGPAADSQAWVWGNTAPDSGERPHLEVNFSVVPEPPGALLLFLGLAGVSVLAWWRGRWAVTPFQSSGAAAPLLS
jgi:hypothetical protein